MTVLEPFYADPLVTLYLGDCLDVMRERCPMPQWMRWSRTRRMGWSSWGRNENYTGGWAGTEEEATA